MQTTRQTINFPNSPSVHFIVTCHLGARLLRRRIIQSREAAGLAYLPR